MKFLVLVAMMVNQPLKKFREDPTADDRGELLANGFPFLRSRDVRLCRIQKFFNIAFLCLSMENID